MKLLVLNASHQDKTVKGLERAAKKASPAARKTILGLAEALKTNPTQKKTPGTGRASAKGETVAKHKARRRAVRRKTNPTNPTRHTRRRTRKNPTSFRRAVAGIDFKGVVMDGAAIVGGELAQSFLQKQVSKILPSTSGSTAGLISSVALVAGGLYFGKGSKVMKNVAIGAAAAGIRGLAKGFAPSMFAGDDVAGDEVSGVYDFNPYGIAGDEVAGDDVAGVYDFNPNY